MKTHFNLVPKGIWTSAAAFLKQFPIKAAFAITLLTITACKKENTPTITLNEQINTAVSSPQSMPGVFSNGGYGVVTGTAKVYLTNGKYQLSFQDFNSSNGPDLRVYLSKERQPVNFVELGPLKSTSGNQIYDIPDGIIVKDYPYALVYCKRFQHLFGFSQLTY